MHCFHILLTYISSLILTLVSLSSLLIRPCVCSYQLNKFQLNWWEGLIDAETGATCCLETGHPDLRRQARRPGGSRHPGRHADLWPCRPPAIWQVRRRHHHHHPRQTQPLPDPAHTEEPHREPVPQQPARQPQRWGESNDSLLETTCFHAIHSFSFFSFKKIDTEILKNALGFLVFCCNY